jgi:hypothetical protein
LDPQPELERCNSSRLSPERLGNAPLKHELGLAPSTSRNVRGNQLVLVARQLVVGKRTEHFPYLVVETAPRHKRLPSVDR